MTRSHPEESLGANPGDAALNPADSVAMGVPAARARPDDHNRTFRAFDHPAFRLLFIAFVINQTGFWISHLSLQAQMMRLTDNDTRLIGLLFFFLFLPAFVFAPLAGVAADRFDRKAIVLTCYGAVATCSGALAMLTIFDAMTPGRMLGVAGCMGLSFAFSGPASFAIAANTVPAEDLPSAVSLQSAANNLTRVMGPFVAMPLVANGRFDLSFSAYLLAATTAGILTLMMKIDRFVPEDEESGIFSRMRNGFDHARERHPALPALSIVAVLSFFGVSHTVLFTSYASDVLQDSRTFTWLVCATGIGAFAGALRSGRTSHPGVFPAALTLVAYGLAFGLFAWTRDLAVALVAQVFVGYCYFAVMTSLQTLIQQVVDESKRGRVMSLFQVCWAGLVPFGSLAMGYAAVPLGTPLTMGIAALVCIAYGLGVAVVSRGWATRIEASP
ncbi:MAG: MFS transporter [bacterium]|nr:MFS transporter [bacterium]